MMAVTIAYSTESSVILDPPLTGFLDGTAIGLADGGYLLLAEQGTTASEGAFVDRTGEPTGQTLVLAGVDPAVAQLTNGTIVIVNTALGGVLFRGMTTGGTAAIGLTDLGGTGWFDPDVAALRNGGFVIATCVEFGLTREGDADIQLRFFNSAGQFASSAIVDITTLRDIAPAVTVLDNGNVAVTWSRETGTITTAWYAVYTAGGVQVRGPTQVDVPAGMAPTPQIVATPAGFNIVYTTDVGRSAGFSDIAMAMYDGSGGLLGRTFVTGNGGVQFDSPDSHPQVIRLAHDTLAVTMERDNGEPDVILRIIGADGTGLSSLDDILGDASILDAQTRPDLATLGATGLAVFAHDPLRGIIGERMDVYVTQTGDEANDTMTPRRLPDLFIGGNGTDTVTYIASNAGVNVNLLTNFAVSGVAEGDRFFSIENLIGSAFGDRLVGARGLNVLSGEGGDDAIFGGDSADTLNGGSGNDTLEGGVGRDVMNGGADNDTLNGGAGADVMTGGGGSDLYYIDNLQDGLIELFGLGEGDADRVATTVSFTLFEADSIELLTTTSTVGTTAINLTGNEAAQKITGNAGANVLSDGGGSGVDTLTGLGGNDTYILRNAGAVIVEGAGQGTSDRLAAGVSFTLAADDNIEVMTTSSSGATTAINLTGNALRQTLTGNAGANRLDGGGGNDTMTGGAGADSFQFSAALAGNIDTITDFNVAADTIRLENAVFIGLSPGTLTTADFRLNGTGLAGDASDRIIYEADTGNLYFDVDGTGATARVQFAVLDAGLVLTSADFLVI